MLQDFIICVNAVIPSAIYLLVGIVLKLAHVVTDEEVKRFTHMTFIALYPFMMFDNLYGKSLGDFMNARLVGYVLFLVVFQIACAWIFVCRIEPENRNRGVMIQAIYRSNIVLMGLPVAANIFGKGNVTSVAVVIMIVVPVYNALAVVIFERFRGGHVDAKHLIKGVLTNPIIVGGLAACVVMLLGINLPSPIYNTIVTLSDSTTPIAMILLGAALNLQGFSEDKAKVAICVVGRLVVSPLIGLAGALLLGLRGVELVAVVVMTATPTALASYAMASSMGGNGKLAGEIVVVSTLVACFTMPIWLFILKTGGFF